MPMTTSLGQSRHRFQVGSGLYTTSDAQRGTTPTPSQTQRGVSDRDFDARWFLLDQGTKQAWQDVAQPGWSGRRLFSTVNRLRLSFSLDTTDDPPPGPYLPPTYPVLTLALHAADPSTPDDPTAVWYANVDVPSEPDFAYISLELAYYIARTPATGPPIRGAQWYASQIGTAYHGAYPNLEALWDNRPRGSSPDYFPRVTQPEGTALLCRLTPCTDAGYPGPAQQFSVIVGPPA